MKLYTRKVGGGLSTYFKEDLEYSRVDERVEEADDGVVNIPERPDSYLHEQYDGYGNERAQHRSGPDWDDFLAKRVCELGIYDLAVLEVDGERTRRSWMSFVDS